MHKIWIHSETYLTTSSNGEFLEGTNVINEKIHQAQFVTEANQDVQSRRMEGNAVRLLSKLLVQLQVTGNKNMSNYIGCAPLLVSLLKHKMTYW